MDKLIEELRGKDPVTDIVIKEYESRGELLRLNISEDDESRYRHHVAALGVLLRKIAREQYGLEWTKFQ